MKAALLLPLLPLLALTQTPNSRNLIVSDVPFRADAVVQIKPDPACVKIHQTEGDFRTAEEREKLKTCAPHKIETGSVNGIAYQFYYSDGSGTFTGKRDTSIRDVRQWKSHWNISCDKDAITDEKTCHMDRGDIRVWVDSRGRSEIYVGSDHYPGSLVVIRIDKGSPLAISSRSFNGSFGFRSSPAIIKQVSRAKVVTTRFQKWPDRSYGDDTWEPYGFNEALQYIRWAVARIK